MQIFPKLKSISSACIAGSIAAFAFPSSALAGLECPETSNPHNHDGTTLQTFATNQGDGVVYDTGQAGLTLSVEGGVFGNTNVVVGDKLIALAVGDYDEDGWMDFVAGFQANNNVRFYRNRTFDNPAPDWTVTSAIRTPKFTPCTDGSAPPCSAGVIWEHSAGNTNGFISMAGGDFNNDGHADFIHVKRRKSSTPKGLVTHAKIYLGNGDATFQTPYDFITTTALDPVQHQIITNAFVTDWNEDGYMDILWGRKDNKVLALLNNCPDGTPTVPCSINPTFTSTDAISNTGQVSAPGGSANKGAQAITYMDFDGNGYKDLLVTGATYHEIRFFPGSPSGIDQNVYHDIDDANHTFRASTVLIGADFSLDGKPDLIAGTDRFGGWGHWGAMTFYLKNDGDTQPFTAGPEPSTENCDDNLDADGNYVNESQTPTVARGLTMTCHQEGHNDNGRNNDWDLGVVINYDNDPLNTPDFIIADGNNSSTYYLMANRVTSQYAPCGEVYSDIIDLGDNADTEMVVTSARLAPTMNVPSGTTVEFYMSNEEPASWVLASICSDNPNEYCVTFPQPVGREVRWKAKLCSNGPNYTQTPSVTGVEVKYDFTVAVEHYRAGVIVHDGVIYLGGFHQPGERGRFYAYDAALGSLYWQFGSVLDGMSDASRHIYTATTDGKTRLDFSLGNASNTDLIAALGTGTQAQAESIITWQRSARFGVGNDGIAKTKLGSVELSTPAVVTKPGIPAWYALAEKSDRQTVDAFITAKAARKTSVLFGSKDGAIHAVFNDATNLSDVTNGTEAWAFIPQKTAVQFDSDRIAPTPTAYPDGAPSVADVKIDVGSGVEMRTVAVFGHGNGGRSITAIDITDADTAGPQPLWHYQPSDAGLARSKPALTRVNIGGTEKFLAIFGTGLAPENPAAPFTTGRTLEAVDLATGVRQWRFQALCPITSHITAFETDDDDEAGDPKVDGFIDRIVFADYCGNVYKLNPNAYVGGTSSTDGYLVSNNVGLPAGNNTNQQDPAGNDIFTLFQSDSAQAINGERPISGVIAARSDSTNRVVLFFGTGGIESFDPSLQNEFYAVYADNGSLRGKLQGTCSSGLCEKFYGGIVVTSEQVILTRTFDPLVASGTCDVGSSKIEGYKLNADAGGDFVVDFASPSLPPGAIVSSLFGDAGAVYASNLAGDVIRIGTPRSASAGGDSSNGHGGGYGDGEDGGPPQVAALSHMGWRQIY